MIPGDPYETKELDERRSRQRRLRLVLAEPLSWAGILDNVDRPAPDPAVEHYARLAADVLMRPHEDYIAYLERIRSGNILAKAIKVVPDNESYDSSAMKRLKKGRLTQDPLPSGERLDAKVEEKRDDDLREALLLIDLAELHSRALDADSEDR